MLRRRHGETIWVANLGEKWCPVVPLRVGELIIVTMATGRLMGFSAHSGEVVWEWEAPGGRIGVFPYRRGQRGHVGGPVVLGDKLAIAGVDGSLTLLDPALGSELRRWETGTLSEAPVVAPLGIDGDTLYATDLSGELSAWRLPVGADLHHTRLTGDAVGTR